MTRQLNSFTHPCACRVWRYKTRRWLPSRTCDAHANPGLDYLRRIAGVKS